MSLVCHHDKIKLDEVELRSPSFDRFPFLLYVSFYNFAAAENWVSITRLGMKRSDDRSELRINERLSLRFFFYLLASEWSSRNPESHSRLKIPMTNSGIQYLESGIDRVESRIQDCNRFSYMGRLVTIAGNTEKQRDEIGRQHNINTLCCRLSPFIISPPMFTQVRMWSQAWILVNTTDLFLKVVHNWKFSMWSTFFYLCHAGWPPYVY